MARTIFVTGASSGIGADTVSALVTAGHTVYAGARRVARMQSLERAGAHLLALDVTDDASMIAAVEAIVRESGRIDVLVNNAGYGSYGALEDVPLDEGRRQFDVNLFWPRAPHPARAADHADATFRADHQCLVDRRKARRAVRQLVSRCKVCRGGSERLAAHGVAPVRHRRHRHRAGSDSNGVERHRA